MELLATNLMPTQQDQTAQEMIVGIITVNGVFSIKTRKITQVNPAFTRIKQMQCAFGHSKE